MFPKMFLNFSIFEISRALFKEKENQTNSLYVVFQLCRKTIYNFIYELNTIT